MIPYAYCVTFLPTGQRYYGVQYGRNAHPSNLFTTYFTSSKSIKKLISKFGIESFSFEIRKIFDISKIKSINMLNSSDYFDIISMEAQIKRYVLNWEDKVLKRLNARSSTGWFNLHHQ